MPYRDQGNAWEERKSFHPQPLDPPCLPVCALQVGAHEATVPERGAQALVAEEPAHLVQAGATA
jgi:hypothetical protein